MRSFSRLLSGSRISRKSLSGAWPQVVCKGRRKKLAARARTRTLLCTSSYIIVYCTRLTVYFVFFIRFKRQTHRHTHPCEEQCKWQIMTRMAGPECAAMSKLINTHTHTRRREHHNPQKDDDVQRSNVTVKSTNRAANNKNTNVPLLSRTLSTVRPETTKSLSMNHVPDA